jgi:hypothetical protein
MKIGSGSVIFVNRCAPKPHGRTEMINALDNLNIGLFVSKFKKHFKLKKLFGNFNKFSIA